MVEHPQVVLRVYPIAWKRPDLDLMELAKYRWIQKWSVPRLAAHFERSPNTLQAHLCRMKKTGKWRSFDLTKEELGIITNNVKKVF